MSKTNPTAQESIGAEKEETFAFAPVEDAGRVNVANLSYGVDNAADHTYTVQVDDVGRSTTGCTCPAAKYNPKQKCKHREAVEAEKQTMADAAPDVRADGGSLGETIGDALARSFTLGVDGHGMTHHYWRPADTVVVFDETGVEYRHNFAESGRTLREWVAFVTGDRGWNRQGQLAGLAEEVDAKREVGR